MHEDFTQSRGIKRNALVTKRNTHKSKRNKEQPTSDESIGNPARKRNQKDYTLSREDQEEP